MFVFKHPKYYKELRERNKSDQVISGAEATAEVERAPGPGHKPQAPSIKLQASSKPEPSSGSSFKHQAASVKSGGTSIKLQAASSKFRDS